MDRRALPAPGDSRGDGNGFRPPETPLGRLLARVLAEVLGAPRVGLGDNFFQLGGHSLLATKVFARLNDFLDLELPLQLIFEAADVAGLERLVASEVASRPGGAETLELLAELDAMSDEELALLEAEDDG